MNPHLLSLTVFLPIAGALLCLAIPKESATRSCRWVNLLANVAVFAATIAIALAWHRKEGLEPAGSPGYALVEDASWISALSIRYHLGVDGVSVVLLLLTSFVSLMGAIASWRIEKSAKGYHAMYLFLLTGMLGVFTSLDTFLFYVFWEVMLLPMYFLIGVWGGPRRQYAAIKFFLYTFAGSVLLLAGLVYIYVRHGTFQIPEITRLAETNQLFGGSLTPAILCFLGFFVAFAIKVPTFPFHTWLPDAHVEAPTPISMILAGVLLKMGGYGLIRMAYPFFPHAAATPWVETTIVVLSFVSIVYGALVAMAQKDFKKLVAYSSVSHMGFVTLGLATMTPAGVDGAMYMMLAHGTISAMLFMVVGVIYDRAHHRDLDRFGGLAWAMPTYFVLGSFAIFASLGLPGLSGFVAEMTVLLASFARWPAWALLATLGMVVTAGYYLITLQKVFLGTTPPVYLDKAHYPDTSSRELLVLVPLAVVTLYMGILPAHTMDLYRHDLERVFDTVRQVADVGRSLPR
jgi:NADH-quinone oxidoreductase subunit M